MFDPEHLKILKQGVKAFNKWREESLDIEPNLSEKYLIGANLSGANFSGAYLRKANFSEADLRGANLSGSKLIEADLSKADLREANLSGADLNKADLSGTNLSGANLSKADLREADFREADVREADLSGADLRKAYLYMANLSGANLSKANLREADLREADVREADLSGADLSGANLQMAIFVETRLEGTNISNSRVYGISAWNLKIDQETNQINLVITQYNEPVITVDNLEVAQFIYLLRNNEKIRDVIDTIGKKVVLIIGRFTKERKAILDAIRGQLRERDYLPILFDFQEPASKDLKTVSALAYMARFIIADLTEPRSFPHKLATMFTTLSVPVLPLLLEGSTGEHAMFQDLDKFDWVLSVHRYKNLDDLLETFEDKLVLPAEEKAKELLSRKQ